ncbi:MAG: class I SAM-dependent methyltransferase [Cyclobacteriaceae bacterium]
MECNCCGFDDEFNSKSAQKELASYRKNGPKASTKLLIDFFKQHDITDYSLLDIGGGVGAIQFELMKLGIAQVCNVDAAGAYLKVALQEAEKRNVASEISFFKGDFVALSAEVDNADIVTLDKVICCYEHMANLVEESINKARKYYAIVIPQDKWWVKWGHSIGESFRKLKGDPFRSYIHPVAEIEKLISNSKFSKAYETTQFHWLIQVYERD